jgi:D-tyrosyl-tRNA(Tyr) deacylase
MKAVLQRVTSARVQVDERTVGEIGKGLLILLGVAGEDHEADAKWLAEKIASLRIFPDSQGKMNLSIKEAAGSALVVSQFTLLGDCRKGRRPSFDKAAPPEKAESLYQRFVEMLRQGGGLSVATGTFGAMMAVSLVNDGPVTLILNSPNSRDSRRSP